MKILRENLTVFGPPDEGAVSQIDTCLKTGSTAVRAALMADHHLGYSMPVGGVIARRGAISPSEIGFDQHCGNKAILTDARISDVDGQMDQIMDEVVKHISFGVGRINNEEIDHDLFNDSAWEIPILKGLKDMARKQLGTVGSGNHYVDIFHDELGRIWIGCHFGSRGLGHKAATHYIKEGGGKDGIFVEPAIIYTDTDLGREFIASLDLTSRYAYAGRDWVCSRVAKILGANILEEVHNHHNSAWHENHEGEDLWVVRKGATPAFPNQKGFVGGTMGENSVILEGVDHEECKLSLYSTVHGAGRVMSRTEAAGKSKWKNGVKTRISEGKVSQNMMDEWVLNKAGVVLRGGGVDESPHCYKRLHEVLEAHSNTVQIIHTLRPLGVAMAGDVFDPYKD